MATTSEFRVKKWNEMARRIYSQKTLKKINSSNNYEFFIDFLLKLFANK